MKFGKKLNEKKSLLVPRYKAACIDYKALKNILRKNLLEKNATLKLSAKDIVWKKKNTDADESTSASVDHFSSLVSDRLRALSVVTPTFLRSLDAEVAKFSKFFEEETNALRNQTIQASNANNETSETHTQQDPSENDALLLSPGLTALESIADANIKTTLKAVLKLERFLLLNYTGITKILKKHDKITGLSLRQEYLARLSDLPFYRSESLTTLKQSLMDRMANAASPSAAQGGAGSANVIPGASSNDISALVTPFALSAGARVGSRGNVTLRGPGVLKSAEPPKNLLPQQRVLISLTGPHGTDIIGCVLDCAAKHDCEIEDFMLARLYHQVTFGVLVRLCDDQVEIFKDLADSAERWDGTLAYEVHDPQDILPKSMDDAPYADRIKYAATVLNANGLTSRFLNDWTKLLLEKKISVERMIRLNEGKVSCAEFRLSVPGDTDMDELRTTLFTLSSKHATDVALQPNDVFRRSKRLVVFDMDSTLIQQEVIDEIARHAGVVDEVAANTVQKITEAAMNGEIQFKESLRRRVALLKGTPTDVISKVKDSLVFTEGARFLCKTLKKLGYKLAVISGGFMPLALHVKNELHLDYAFANQLKTTPDNKFLTGETIGPIVDGARKAELLEVIAQAESVTLEQVVAVGDGANDFWMLNAAGLGVAFNAKIFLQKNARARINTKSLKHVLYLLGYSDEEARSLGEE